MPNDSLRRISLKDLADNPSNRLPVVLCLDISGSMKGDPIRELNAGIRLFIQAVREDPFASASVELLVVTFADKAKLETDFMAVDSIQWAEATATGGHTDLGGGVILSLDKLNERKNLYQTLGIDYFQPWLVLMTDGIPTTETHRTASVRTLELEGAGKLTVFPIGIGDKANLTVLKNFSKKNDPLRLGGLKFREFFQWLSRSVAVVSASRPGEKTKLPPITGWTEV